MPPLDNFLPQSEIPAIGAPLATVRVPNVPVQIPNPLDVRSFFNASAGARQNLQLLQNAEQMVLRKQEMDLRNYESFINEVNTIDKTLDAAFTNLHQLRSDQKKGSADTISSIYGSLDPTKPQHARIIKEADEVVQGAQAELDNIVRTHLNSGAKDPASRYEARRMMENTVTRAQNRLRNIDGFHKHSTVSRAYNDWFESLNNVILKKNAGDEDLQGLMIDQDRVDSMIERYEEFSRTGKGNLRVEDFQWDKYFFNASGVLSGIAEDAKNLGLGVEEQAFIEGPGGTTIRGEQTTRRSADDMADILLKKYGNTQEFNRLYKTFGEGKMSRHDFMKLQVLPHAPPEGKDVVVRDLRSPLIDAPKGSAGTSGDGSIASRQERYSILPKKAPAPALAIEEELIRQGFDPGSEEVSSLFKVSNMLNASDDPRNLGVRYLDEKGKEVKSAEDAATKQYFIPSFDYEEEDPETGEIIKRRAEEEVLAKYSRIVEPDDHLITLNGASMKSYGLPFQLKTPNQAVSTEGLNFLKKLASAPVDVQGLVLTEAQADRGRHKHGHNIDVRVMDETGKRLADWLAQPEGKEWLDKTGYEVLYEAPTVSQLPEGVSDGEIIGGVFYMANKDATAPHLHFQRKQSTRVPHQMKEDPVGVGTQQTASGEQIEVVEMDPQEESKYLLDRMIIGEDLTSEEFGYIMENGSEETKGLLSTAMVKVRARQAREERYRELKAKEELGALGRTGRRVMEEIEEDFEQNPVLSLRAHLLNIALHEHKPVFVREAVKDLLFSEPPAEGVDIRFKSGRIKGLRVRQTSTGLVGVQKVRSFGTVPRPSAGIAPFERESLKKVEIWSPQKLLDYIESRGDNISEETLEELYGNQDMVAKMENAAKTRIEEYLVKEEMAKATLEQRRLNQQLEQEVEEEDGGKFQGVDGIRSLISRYGNE